MGTIKQYIISVILLLQVWYSHAQQYTVGDSLPEEFFITVHQAVNMETGEKTVLSLENHRGKLVILYFWFNGCKPCIESLIKFDRMLNNGGDADFVVIPFTYQTAEESRTVIDRFQWDLTSIVSDTALREAFAGPGFMNMAWIKDGKLYATPQNRYATPANILEAAAGDKISFERSVKRKTLFNPASAVFNEENSHFSTRDSRIGRYAPEFSRMDEVWYVRKKDSTILIGANLTLEELFIQAYKNELFIDPDISGNKVRWNMDSSLVTRITGGNLDFAQSSTLRGDSVIGRWMQDHLYGYELRLPGQVSESSARRRMQADLDAYFRSRFGIYAQVASGHRQIYGILKTIGSASESQLLLQRKANDQPPAGYLHLPNGQFYSHIIKSMAEQSLRHATDVEVTLPLIDSTGIAKNLNVDIRFPKAMRSGWTLENINSELKRYGLFIEIRKARAPILILNK